MNDATRMRDGGRSWTEIAEKLSISVKDAKALVRVDKIERRKVLSETQIAEDRNGLRDLCVCEHERKLHENKEGTCTVCSDECEGFEQPQMFSKRWWDRRRALMFKEPYTDRRGHYIRRPPERVQVDPDIQLSDRVAVAAYQLGVSWDSKGPSPVPHPSLTRKVRRAKKRLAQGKPVYKKIDRDRFW